MPWYVRTLLMTGPPDEVQEASRGHLAHLRDLRLRGKLRVAGEFRNGEGFLEIFEAVDVLEAEEIGRSSPLVTDGLAVWMLREWSELDLD